MCLGDITTGQVGYWAFEEGSGTTAADSSGNGFTGTLAGTPLPTWVPGVVGGALDFAGGANTSQVQVSTPTSSSLQITGSMTLAAWVWADTVNNAARIVTKSPNTASTRGWGLNMETASGGILRLQIATNNSGIASCGITGAVPTGVWFHLAGVYDAAAQTMKLYTNGVLGQTRTAANGVTAAQYNNTTVPVTIGAFSNAPTGTRWDGKHAAAGVDRAGESASAGLGQVLWPGVSAADVSPPEPLCAVSAGKASAPAQSTGLAAPPGNQPVCAFEPSGTGEVVNAFWKRRRRREPDEGNLHVRFDEGEASQRRLTTAVGSTPSWTPLYSTG